MRLRGGRQAKPERRDTPSHRAAARFRAAAGNTPQTRTCFSQSPQYRSLHWINPNELSKHASCVQSFKKTIAAADYKSLVHNKPRSSLTPQKSMCERLTRRNPARRVQHQALFQQIHKLA